MVLRTLNIDVVIKNVNLAAGEHLDEAFLKLNPNHQIPILVDGDFVLSESRAIMAYIVNSKKPGHSLYPVNSKIRAKIDQLLYFDAVVLFEQNAMAIVRTFMNLIIKFYSFTNYSSDAFSWKMQPESLMRGSRKLTKAFDSWSYF